MDRLKIVRTTFSKADEFMNNNEKMFDRKTNKMFWTVSVFNIKLDWKIVWVASQNFRDWKIERVYYVKDWKTYFDFQDLKKDLLD